ncbi:MAG: acetolactate synthase small subunit [Chloroflexota bacterium]|nr:acetolactate synthase small subunit [Chloroflexota bacterium]
MAIMKHTLVALVEDKPGVLNRITSMIRRRNFNIDSIAVGPSATPGLSRIVIIVDGATTAVEQVRKQLDKIVRVVKVTDISGENIVSRELALIKVESNPETRGEIIQLTNIFRGNMLDVTPESIVIEITGDENKISSFIELLRGFGVIELARTGRIAMARGVLGPLLKQEKATPKKSKKPKDIK